MSRAKVEHVARWKNLVCLLAALVLSSVVLGFIGTLGYGFWHIYSPGGSNAVVERTRHELVDTYQQGLYSEVVLLFESPIEVRLGPDETLASRNYNSQDLMFMVGESYLLTGDHDAARLHFLRVIGWSKLEYEAYCGLDFTDCSDPDNLRKMAAVHNAAQSR